jgi:2'-5' RNA ligase
MDLRTFIAIELPGDLREHIYARTSGLRSVARSVKWVPAENLHITLKFLGNMPETLLPEIEKAIREAVTSLSAFEMVFTGAGAFPESPKKPPRVVWVGVEAPDVLYEVQRGVEAAMAPLGFEPETRPYSPHLTIGRVRQPPRGGLLRREMETLEGEKFGKVLVGEVALMKSTLHPAGARYERLFSFPLGG